MELDFRIWNGFRMIHGEELRLLTEDMFIKSGYSEQYHNHICIPRMEDLKVMQCIGLKDCFGKKIFQYDIIKFIFDGVWKISLVDLSLIKGTTVTFKSIGGKYTFNLSEIFSKDRKLEIIGNFYENKDVIEKYNLSI
ncbi:YopX family protein [Clostridioides difficile]|uniref:YopX family protein n=1 Tax=Clostridioides difficile TaxID=1496 RepID=UPI000D1F3798|nr:YopX family protein [Clostridioides difficile]MBY2508815.1 hypothetical protein [Clostridioides difficile]MCM4101047.1 YopX family protein [Clostridioides difficile]MDM9773593.1 YopX family protein [Clostridioides difficile]HBF7477288.1 hypothetical protein [Clostridioides difficile]HBG2116806.1 hypothetical protein [Clostridioides difficile]